MFYVDLLVTHVVDWKQFMVSMVDYLWWYFVGYYNLLGNHFCAFVMVDLLVCLLDSKLASYGLVTLVSGGFIK